MQVNFKTTHENVKFIEEYCSLNDLSLDDFLNHCVSMLQKTEETIEIKKPRRKEKNGNAN